MFVCWKSLQAQSPVLYRQEWKRGNHKHLGQVRAYEPKPPASSATDVDPNQYPLKLIKLDYDPNPSLKGWTKFRISIPPAVRARYIDDQVFGEDWSNILKDFDQKPFDWIIHFLVCYLLKIQPILWSSVQWDERRVSNIGFWISLSLVLTRVIFLHGARPLYFPQKCGISISSLRLYTTGICFTHIIYIYIQLCTYNISPYFYLHLLRYSPKSNADATAALALVKKEEEDATKVIEPWTNEPETLEELMDKYIVEAKGIMGVPCSWSRAKPVMEAPIKSFRVRSTNFLWQQGWYIIPLDARPIKCFHISVDKNMIINI